MKLHTFTALPKTPSSLNPLLEIASNLWFSWNWDARQLFAKADKEIWKQAQKNPLRMLCDIPQEKMEELAENKDFLSEMSAVYTAFQKYMSGKTWFEEQFGPRNNKVVAYFSCEYGIHESLPIYSGGLGVLSGDHLKSASDLGIPLVAIGLFYREGYFRQGLNADGDQIEFYPENDKFTMPVVQQKDSTGKPLIFSMDIGGEEVFYQVWKVEVGRIPLYLLDTNLACNLDKHRDITRRLYDANRDTRLRQEILLGIGGVKVLRDLGLDPVVYHINEGHSALLVLERIRHLMEDKEMTFEEAKEIVWATSVFTTHTPVPAGNERFDVDLLKKYLSNMVEKRLALNWKEFCGFGRENPEDEKEEFCLTVLALKFCSMANGVAKLHGEVSRDMWKHLYKLIPKNEIPISHITNGVHTKTWLSKNFEQLFIRYLHTSYNREIGDFNIWKVVDEIPDLELWTAHIERKKGLVEYVRERLKFQLKRRGASASEISKTADVLNPKALIIGFARRFAPYKRGDLVFKDLERLTKLCCDAKRPVQFIFAGKAHPADQPGKAIIKHIADISKKPDLYKSVVFLEDYDLDMARFLVQGVDVWLNNPRRPMEASGTSGMKAAMNGAVNVSILDGWWDEAFDGTNGFAIGSGEMYTDLAVQDEVEANLLYRLLEHEVVPLFYEANEYGVPERWIDMMKKTISSNGDMFNSHRMVIDYLRNFYLKGEDIHAKLSVNNFMEAKNLAKWRNKITDGWNDLEIVEVLSPEKETYYAGGEVEIKAKLRLGNVTENDIVVEVYHGRIDQEEHIISPLKTRMEAEKRTSDYTMFKAMIPCSQGGRYGYTIRVRPGNDLLQDHYIPELVRWHE